MGFVYAHVMMGVGVFGVVVALTDRVVILCRGLIA